MYICNFEVYVGRDPSKDGSTNSTILCLIENVTKHSDTIYFVRLFTSAQLVEDLVNRNNGLIGRIFIVVMKYGQLRK